jgi:general secretion pathway protein A
MNRQLALYALKHSPFSPGVPVEALYRSARTDSFCQRVRQRLGEGGFMMVTGAPGVGKSTTLRVLTGDLSQIRDVVVGVLSRPQASIADFYRELSDLFGVQLRPHNRWNCTQVLRARWQAHIEASAYRPVLLVDEAQQAQPTLLEELRLLSSAQLDSRLLLTVVLAGDERLTERLRCDDLAPLASRIRMKLTLDRISPEELREYLCHAMRCAGAPNLMTDGLLSTLCDHAQGNLRALMNLAGDLLDLATQRELPPPLDEKLFFDAYPAPTTQAKAAGRRR